MSHRWPKNTQNAYLFIHLTKKDIGVDVKGISLDGVLEMSQSRRKLSVGSYF